MTELDYIIQTFDTHFGPYKGKRIALFPGQYLEAIRRSFDAEYHFHCVLDPETGEVPEGIDLLILTDHRKGKEPDYHKVRSSCEERGILLMDTFGTDQIALHREIKAQEYLTIAQWKALLSRYDVISLLVSNVATDYDERLARWVLRRRFTVLYDFLKSQGKTVVFHYDQESQLIPLREAGIHTEGLLFFRSEQEFGYPALRERYPDKKILHVGVGTVKDGIVPRGYGMDSRMIRYYTFQGSVGDEKSSPIYGDKEALRKAIDENDIISFDIFDTLLKRMVLEPKDVFALVEERTKVGGFAKARSDVQLSLPEGTLEDYYRLLQENYGYDSQTCARLRQTELTLESTLILPRKSMVEIYDYAKQKGKTIVLLSDMYLKESFLRSLLDRSGVTGYHGLILSGRYRRLKQDGLFEQLKDFQKNGETILHIGDDAFSDVISANEFGIKAIRVPSCLETARKNGFEKAIQQCQTLGDRKALGLSVALGFDDPFEPVEESQVANMILGPLIMGYLQWARSAMIGRGYDAFLLSARDGWILLDTYNKLRAKAPKGLPEGRYFYTSRHAAYVTIMDDPQLASYFFTLDRYPGKPEALMEKVFSLSKAQILPYEGQPLMEYYHRHAAAIREAADIFRANFRTYLDSEGLTGKKCALMDFVSEGSSQMMLEKHMDLRLDGLYIGIPEYVSKYAENIRYYFGQDLMDYTTEMRLEVYFTSLESAVNTMGKGGRPVFTKEQRSAEDLERIRRVHGLVRFYLNAYLDHLYDPLDTIDPAFVFQLCQVIRTYPDHHHYFDDMSGTTIQKDHENKERLSPTRTNESSGPANSR